MKFYVKINGELVEATEEQIKDKAVTLCLEDGSTFREGVAEPDPIDQISDALSGMTQMIETGFSNMSKRIEEVETKVNDQTEAASRGFPMGPGSDVQITPGNPYQDEKLIEAFGPFDLDTQGRRLQDKHHHPMYQIDDANRKRLSTYMILYHQAVRNGSGLARQMLYKFFEKDFVGHEWVRDRGGIDALVRIPVGDTGNTFPIPDIVMEEILHFAREKSVILQYSRVWPMTSEKQSWPAEDTAVTVEWGNETKEHEPGVTEFELTCEELSAYATVKRTTMDDSRSDIVSWLTEALSEAAGLELDDVGFNGDGSYAGGCSGILSAACGYSVVMSSGSTAFSQLSHTFLSEMQSKLDGLKKAGARYWMNGMVLHYVRSLQDSNNRPIFIETVGSPMSGTVYGYPYTEVIKCPSTSAANTAFIAFGNLRYFGVGRRLGVSTLDFDPYGLWTTNRYRYKLYQRWAEGIALANGFVRGITAAS